MSERANGAIIERHAERNHHNIVMSMQKSIYKEIENLYMVDVYNQVIVESAMLTRGW